jgi:hypothetical protein
MDEALSLQRLIEARETLTAAFRLPDNEFRGAIGAVGHAGTFCEAKRNLTALIQVLHGNEAWEKVLDSD